MKLWKRNAVVAAIVLFVCVAVYLNWNYPDGTADTGKTLGEAALVGGQAQDPLLDGEQTGEQGETGGETAEGARTPGDREQAALNALARMYLTHRKEADPAGDLSELLMGWRGQDAPVTFLANGLDPSLENRAACAAAAVIPDYTGTPEQDAALLDALGAGTRPWATTLQGAEE